MSACRQKCMEYTFADTDIVSGRTQVYPAGEEFEIVGDIKNFEVGPCFIEQFGKDALVFCWKVLHKNYGKTKISRQGCDKALERMKPSCRSPYGDNRKKFIWRTVFQFNIRPIRPAIAGYPNRVRRLSKNKVYHKWKSQFPAVKSKNFSKLITYP